MRKSDYGLTFNGLGGHFNVLEVRPPSQQGFYPFPTNILIHPNQNTSRETDCLQPASRDNVFCNVRISLKLLTQSGHRNAELLAVLGYRTAGNVVALLAQHVFQLLVAERLTLVLVANDVFENLLDLEC